MDLATPLRLLFGNAGGETVAECRRCGTTVSEDTERCPECESPDIVTYHL